MKWAWRIGRVRGIEIKVHITFVLALAWGAFVLGWSGPAGRLYGAFLTVILFGNVLLHELGHALAAQRYGIRVEDIILLPIGGVARLHQLPERPKYELVIALAGPAVNLLLAVLVLLFLTPLLLFDALPSYGSLFYSVTQPGILGVLIFMLVTNVSLFLFNLIPAFPMDGGRVLRALLALRQPYARATALAVAVGRGIALLLGLFGFLGGNPGMAFAGLFVFFAASAEGRETMLSERLRGLTVDMAVERHAPLLSADLPVHTAFDWLARSPFTALAVVDDRGDLLGVVTRSHMARLWKKGCRGAVAQFVESPGLAVECATPLDVARRRMAETQAAVVAVYCGGSFEGLLDFDSISRVLALQRIGWYRPRTKRA
jgi:Zn-dependent protease/CBS domain-containing protein